MNYKRLYINGRFPGFGKYNLYNHWNCAMYFLHTKRNTDLVPLILSFITALLLTKLIISC